MVYKQDIGGAGAMLKTRLKLQILQKTRF